MRTFKYNSWLSSVANKSDPRLICRSGLVGVVACSWNSRNGQSVPVIFYSSPYIVSDLVPYVQTNNKQSGTTAFSSIFRLEGEGGGGFRHLATVFVDDPSLDLRSDGREHGLYTLSA